jgi:hypothetical protein
LLSLSEHIHTHYIHTHTPPSLALSLYMLYNKFIFKTPFLYQV